VLVGEGIDTDDPSAVITALPLRGEVTETTVSFGGSSSGSVSLAVTPMTTSFESSGMVSTSSTAVGASGTPFTVMVTVVGPEYNTPSKAAPPEPSLATVVPATLSNEKWPTAPRLCTRSA